MRRIYETCINVDMEIEATHENDDCSDENFICYYILYDSFLYFISGFMVVVTFSFGVLEVVFDEV